MGDGRRGEWLNINVVFIPGFVSPFTEACLRELKSNFYQGKNQKRVGWWGYPISVGEELKWLGTRNMTGVKYNEAKDNIVVVMEEKEMESNDDKKRELESDLWRL